MRNGHSEYVNFFLTSHPKPVAQAISSHREGLDSDPYGYYIENFRTKKIKNSQVAARYLNTNPKQIAWTDSTTMGVGLIYNVKPGQEILTCNQNHITTQNSIKFNQQRYGSSVRHFNLYQNAYQVSKQEILDTIVSQIHENTRVLATTWVESTTGVKIPLLEIGQIVKEINARRPEENRLFFCVDGVHGFGVEDLDIEAMNCDFFSAGCHKWLFGPRGTGILWGKNSAWKQLIPTFTSFMQSELTNEEYGAYHSPGGFKCFEHYWALEQAFHFHLNIGKAEIAARIHSLNDRLKHGLLQISNIVLHTPISSELSAGITSFELKGKNPEEVQKQLKERGVYVSIPPYNNAEHLLRMSPGLMTNEQDIDYALMEISHLANI